MQLFSAIENHNNKFAQNIVRPMLFGCATPTKPIYMGAVAPTAPKKPASVVQSCPWVHFV